MCPLLTVSARREGEREEGEREEREEEKGGAVCVLCVFAITFSLSDNIFFFFFKCIPRLSLPSPSPPLSPSPYPPHTHTHTHTHSPVGTKIFRGGVPSPRGSVYFLDQRGGLIERNLKYHKWNALPFPSSWLGGGGGENRTVSYIYVLLNETTFPHAYST